MGSDSDLKVMSKAAVMLEELGIEYEMTIISAHREPDELIEWTRGAEMHTFVEQTLTARIGDAGKRLHTGRSRNDQVALDIRLTLRDYSHTLQAYIVELVKVICRKAAENTTAVEEGVYETPEDIAAMCMYLASNESSYFTGQVVTVDGGLNAHVSTMAQFRAMVSRTW